MIRSRPALAGIALLVVVVGGGIVLAGLAHLGPFVPDGSGAIGSAERWKSTVTGADFEFKVESRKATFSTEEPLDVVASVTYRGPGDAVMIGHTLWGPIEFFMKAPGATLLPHGPGGCDELDLTRGVPITESLLDLNGAARPFRVAHGLHEVGAFAGFQLGGCNGGQQSLRTTIVVAVADGPDDIPIFTDVASEQRVCLLLRNGGRLTTSANGLAVMGFEGQVREVVWPPGYSARRTPDGAVLVGRDGLVIAREGDQVSFDAYTPEKGPIWPCGGVEAGG